MSLYKCADCTDVFFRSVYLDEHRAKGIERLGYCDARRRKPTEYSGGDSGIKRRTFPDRTHLMVGGKFDCETRECTYSTVKWQYHLKHKGECQAIQQRKRRRRRRQAKMEVAKVERQRQKEEAMMWASFTRFEKVSSDVHDGSNTDDYTFPPSDVGIGIPSVDRDAETAELLESQEESVQVTVTQGQNNCREEEGKKATKEVIDSRSMTDLDVPSRLDGKGRVFYCASCQFEDKHVVKMAKHIMKCTYINASIN